MRRVSLITGCRLRMTRSRNLMSLGLTGVALPRQRRLPRCLLTRLKLMLLVTWLHHPPVIRKGNNQMAKVDNSAWDASKAWANGSASDDPESFFRGICAGEKTTGKPDTQEHWALPHHYHPGDPPNAAGVRNGESRIGQTQGLKNKSAAQKHLDGHMETIKAEEKSGRPVDIRAERAAHAREIPGGNGRIRSFPSKLRASLVTKDGKTFYEFDGYATVFNRSYEM